MIVKEGISFLILTVMPARQPAPTHHLSKILGTCLRARQRSSAPTWPGGEVGLVQLKQQLVMAGASQYEPIIWGTHHIAATLFGHSSTHIELGYVIWKLVSLYKVLNLWIKFQKQASPNYVSLVLLRPFNLFHNFKTIHKLCLKHPWKQSNMFYYPKINFLSLWTVSPFHSPRDNCFV